MTKTKQTAGMPEIKLIKTVDLIPYVMNSRTHSPDQVSQIAASIKEFGFTNPVLTDGSNGIIAGHGRVMAAQKLGIDEVPVIELSYLSEAQRKAYIIADNKLALNAGWDAEALQLELSDLNQSDFDMGLLGFDAKELSAALGMDADLDGSAPPVDTGIDYAEKFAILVECQDEADQQAIFERLDTMGFTCKVLVN